MTLSSRQMRLTAELVAQVPPLAGEPGPMPEGLVRPTDADYEAVVQRILADRPASGEVWIFAYGSLIWNPAFASVEERIGTALGWHRAFCLGWTRIFRASPDRPGLMLALDRGGACKGVAYRLPSDAVEENLGKLVRREMPLKPSPLPARWVSVRMAYGAIRAIAFTIDRNSGRYVGGLSADEIADALAIAVGERGSMAEYLYNTVKHLRTVVSTTGTCGSCRNWLLKGSRARQP